jgi:hypothetical protein
MMIGFFEVSFDPSTNPIDLIVAKDKQKRATE